MDNNESVEYKTLGVNDIAHKYCNAELSRLLLGCNNAEIRNTAAKYYSIWKDTRLDDRPFVWAVICAMNNSKTHNFFEGNTPLVTFNSGFPCLFFNYDLCTKPGHAAMFHYCMLCREVHPLLDFDLNAEPQGKCKLWARLVAEFKNLCKKLRLPANEVGKLFRLDEKSPANPTVRVEKRKPIAIKKEPKTPATPATPGSTTTTAAVAVTVNNGPGLPGEPAAPAVESVSAFLNKQPPAAVPASAGGVWAASKRIDKRKTLEEMPSLGGEAVNATPVTPKEWGAKPATPASTNATKKGAATSGMELPSTASPKKNAFPSSPHKSKDISSKQKGSLRLGGLGGDEGKSAEDLAIAESLAAAVTNEKLPVEIAVEKKAPAKDAKSEQEKREQQRETPESIQQQHVDGDQTPTLAGGASEPASPSKVEYRTLGVNDVAHKYANTTLSNLMLACNNVEVRNTAMKYFNIWKDTNLEDRPFLWACIAAANNHTHLNFFDGLPPVTFSSGFPCLFYNYDLCTKPGHAAVFHYCILCREQHSLLDWDLAVEPQGECKLWMELHQEFLKLCHKLRAEPEEVIKLFRIEPDSPKDPTINVEKRAKAPKKEKPHRHQKRGEEKDDAKDRPSAKDKEVTRSIGAETSRDADMFTSKEELSRAESSTTYDMWGSGGAAGGSTDNLLGGGTPLRAGGDNQYMNAFSAISQMAADSTSSAPGAPSRDNSNVIGAATPEPADDLARAIEAAVGNTPSSAAVVSPMVESSTINNNADKADEDDVLALINGLNVDVPTSTSAPGNNNAPTLMMDLTDIPTSGFIAGHPFLLDDFDDDNNADNNNTSGSMMDVVPNSTADVDLNEIASHLGALLPKPRDAPSVLPGANLPLKSSPGQQAQQTPPSDALPSISVTAGPPTIQSISPTLMSTNPPPPAPGYNPSMFGQGPPPPATPQYHPAPSYGAPIYQQPPMVGGQAPPPPSGAVDCYTLSTWLRKDAMGTRSDDMKRYIQMLLQLNAAGGPPSHQDFLALAAHKIVVAAYNTPNYIQNWGPLFEREQPIISTITHEGSDKEFCAMVVVLNRLANAKRSINLTAFFRKNVAARANKVASRLSEILHPDVHADFNAGLEFLTKPGNPTDMIFEVEQRFKSVSERVYRNTNERNRALSNLVDEVRGVSGEGSCVLDALLLMVEADAQRKVMEAFTTRAIVCHPIDENNPQPQQILKQGMARFSPSTVYTEHFNGSFFTLRVDAARAIPFCDWNPSLFAGQMVQVKDQKGMAHKFTIRSIMPYELVLRADSNLSVDLLVGSEIAVHYLYNPWHFNAMVQSLKYTVVQEYLHDLRNKTIKSDTVNTALVKPNKYLDEKEAEAVSRIIQKPRLLTIWGPPGTGKTHTLVGSVQAIALRKMGRILCCASSNYAANLLALKIKELGDIKVIRIFSASVSPYDVLRSQFRDLLTISNPKFAKPEEDVTIDSEFGRASLDDILSHDVICCTTAHTDWIRNLPGAEKLFSFVFVDEAGQALEAEMLIPFSFCNKNTSLILAGDPLQLGPTILSPIALRNGAGNSFLSKNMSLASLGSFDYVLLQKCYRCHPNILELFNSSFYNNSLQPEAPMTNKRKKCIEYDLLPKSNYPVMFVNVPPVEKINLDVVSRNPTSPLQHVNRNEVQVVVDACRDLVHRYNFQQSDIVVLTPYREQQLAIRSQLVLHRLSSLDTMIVDQFQGQERLVVIISAVTGMRDPRIVNSEFVLGFVGDRKRTNVALSRARGLLIIVGSAEQLATTDGETWGPILNHLNQEGVIVNHQHFSTNMQQNLQMQVSRLVDDY